LSQKIQELGEDAFSVEVLESDVSDRLEAERRWYDLYLERGEGETLNGGRPSVFPEITPEVRVRMSVAHLGIKQSPEHVANRAKAMLGNKNSVGREHSPETRAKMSRSHRGKPLAVNEIKVQCECGMVTNPGNLAQHCAARGHHAIAET
jgi:hypothetical protein